MTKSLSPVSVALLLPTGLSSHLERIPYKRRNAIRFLFWNSPEGREYVSMVRLTARALARCSGGSSTQRLELKIRIGRLHRLLKQAAADLGMQKSRRRVS